MRIDRVELRIVRLPLIRSFATSSSSKDYLEHILVRVGADGLVGWGECASPSAPFYCEETTETCWHILKDFLVPAVLGRTWETIDDVVAMYGKVKRNNFARAGLEMGCCDLLAQSRGEPLHALLGGRGRRSCRALVWGSRTGSSAPSSRSISTSARGTGGSS